MNLPHRVTSWPILSVVVPNCRVQKLQIQEVKGKGAAEKYEIDGDRVTVLFERPWVKQRLLIIDVDVTVVNLEYIDPTGRDTIEELGQSVHLPGDHILVYLFTVATHDTSGRTLTGLRLRLRLLRVSLHIDKNART